MKKMILCFGLAGLIFWTGCASIMSGSNQRVAVNSFPDGATAKIGNSTQLTPAVFNLSRKDGDQTVTVSKPGYVTVTEVIGKTLNPWVIGNVIWGVFGFFIGMVVDASTGAVTKFTPDKIDVTLVEEE